MKNKRETKLEKTVQNRAIYLVGLLSGIVLCFLVWYGAALFHEPEITDRNSQKLQETKNLKMILTSKRGYNFDKLIIQTRGGMAVWNACARSLWAIAVGLGTVRTRTFSLDR